MAQPKHYQNQAELSAQAGEVSKSPATTEGVTKLSGWNRRTRENLNNITDPASLGEQPEGSHCWEKPC